MVLGLYRSVWAVSLILTLGASATAACDRSEITSYMDGDKIVISFQSISTISLSTSSSCDLNSVCEFEILLTNGAGKKYRKGQDIIEISNVCKTTKRTISRSENIYFGNEKFLSISQFPKSTTRSYFLTTPDGHVELRSTSFHQNLRKLDEGFFEGKDASGYFYETSIRKEEIHFAKNH